MRTLLFCAVLLCAAAARAENFTITLFNGSNSPWLPGLVTTAGGLIAVGPTPTSGNALETYKYVKTDCDTNCGTGCDDDGNPTVLAQRTGLNLTGPNINAWTVPAIAVNGSHTLTITATNPQQLFFIASVATASDDFVALHPVGDVNTLTVPLFTGGGTALGGVTFEISGYDVNSSSATDGNAASCGGTACVPTSPCFVAGGNGTTGRNFSTAYSVPQVAPLTSTAGNGQNRLFWSNVAPHSGTLLIRRTGGAVTFAPAANTNYALNASLGSNQFVAFTDNSSAAASSAIDNGLTNGTTYQYKAFARFNEFDAGWRWSATAGAPVISSTPTSRTGTDPLWCHSFGLSSLTQPLTEVSAGLFSAANAMGVAAARTTPGVPATDGDERWRPVSLDGGSVQGRPTLVPIVGETDRFIFAGAQNGTVVAINASTGATKWVASPTTNPIQAQPAAQLFQYSNSTFQSAHPGRDLIFVATMAAGTGNKVYALNSTTGALVWTSVASIGGVAGGMLVDYPNNRLYVAHAGTTNSLVIISTINGTTAGTVAVGATSAAVNLDAKSNQAYVINSAGTAYGIGLDGGIKWTGTVGPTTSWLFPLGNGFIASRTNGGTPTGTRGRVVRFAVPSDGGAPTQVWQTPNITSPTGVTVEYNSQRVFVGDGIGVLREFELGDGGFVDQVFIVPGSGLSQPTIDTTVGRLHVSTADGRLCAYPYPLP